MGVQTKNMIFDTHAHYDDSAFDEDRETLLASLQSHGVGTVVNSGASLDGCRRTIELTEQYPFIYGALGVHPDEVGELNEELKKPVVIHSREAAADTMEILKAEVTDEISYEMHCYSYSPEMAREYLKMGFYLGIGGVLTFKNAKKLKEVVEEAPIERLLLETDCPYLAPVPNRGKRNDSTNIHYVAEELAKIKGITAEEVIRITEENARRFYRILEENA